MMEEKGGIEGKEQRSKGAMEQRRKGAKEQRKINSKMKGGN